MKGSNMKRRSRIAAASVIVAALVLASSATATSPPSGNGLPMIPVMCGPIGGPFSTPATLTVARGAAFWIDNQKYVLTSITSSFDGVPPVTKNYGARTGQTAGSIECTGSFMGTTFDGMGVTAT
jgi:hypothetical protein